MPIHSCYVCVLPFLPSFSGRRKTCIILLVKEKKLFLACRCLIVTILGKLRISHRQKSLISHEKPAISELRTEIRTIVAFTWWKCFISYMEFRVSCQVHYNWTGYTIFSESKLKKRISFSFYTFVSHIVLQRAFSKTVCSSSISLILCWCLHIIRLEYIPELNFGGINNQEKM